MTFADICCIQRINPHVLMNIPVYHHQTKISNCVTEHIPAHHQDKFDIFGPSTNKALQIA